MIEISILYRFMLSLQQHRVRCLWSESMRKRDHITVGIRIKINTVDPDFIATEMLAFPSKSSRNQNYSIPRISSPLMRGQLIHVLVYGVKWA